MSSYAGLYAGDKVVFTYRDREDQAMLSVFSAGELSHLTGNKAIRYAMIRWGLDDMSSEEIEDLEIFVYAASAGVLKDRLNVLGFGEALIKETFEEELKDKIEHTATFARMHSDKDFIKLVEEDLRKLQKLDYDTWAQQVNSYISSKLSVNQEEVWSYDEGPFKLLSDVDQRIILWAILEHIDEKEVVTLDLTDRVSNWL